MDAQRFFTPKEAAEYLRIKQKTIYKFIADGELRCYKIGVGRDIRISIEQIEEYLERHEEKKGNE